MSGQPKNCGGCGKAFTAARKLVGTFRDGYMPFKPGTTEPSGQVFVRLVPVCRKCKAYIAAGGRPYNLPAFERGAEQLEQLAMAEPTGRLQ